MGNYQLPPGTSSEQQFSSRLESAVVYPDLPSMSTEPRRRRGGQERPVGAQTFQPVFRDAAQPWLEPRPFWNACAGVVLGRATVSGTGTGIYPRGILRRSDRRGDSTGP